MFDINQTIDLPTRKPAVSVSDRDALQYMASMTMQLAQMAAANRYKFANYLLAMAHAELYDMLRGERPMRDQGTRTVLPRQPAHNTGAGSSVSRLR